MSRLREGRDDGGAMSAKTSRSGPRSEPAQPGEADIDGDPLEGSPSKVAVT